jgi:hypothetical protein
VCVVCASCCLHAMLDVVFLFDENLAIGCQRQINLAS